MKVSVVAFMCVLMFQFLSVQELHREILEAVSGAPSAHPHLVFDKKKPIPLKLLTPKLVEV